MKNTLFKISLLSSLVFLSLYARGDDYFDPSMLESQLGIDSSQIDLSQFTSSNKILPGKYIIQLQVNRNILGDKEINYVANEHGDIVPEFTLAQLASWGVNVNGIPKLHNLKSDAKITNLAEYVQDATVTSNIQKLSLTLSIPQIAMSEKSQGFIDPALLDNGISALFFNYFVSGNKSRNEISSNVNKNDNMFATIRAGMNLGPWRLRSTYSYSHSSGDYGSSSSSDFSNTYIMRAFHSIRSMLSVGEISTGNDVFDTVPFKGVKIVSDENMLPSSQRGFAPEINGIAQSNARVTVRQNGYIVYETYVAPGAFKLKDIYASGNAGDLQVTITEENGSEKTFTVAFSSLPIMLRPGGYRYEASVGRYNGGYTTDSKEADFFLGSFSYGLPIDATVYGGTLVAKDYISFATGLGISLGVAGAMSADITHSTTNLDNGEGNRNGQSYRVRYSKSMTTTGTSIDLTALRYSTRDYFSFTDFNNYNRKLKDDVAPWLNQRQRSSFTTSLTQSLNDYGSVFVTGSIYDYWDSDRKTKQLTVGYNTTVKQINYSVNYSISRVKDKTDWPENRQISLNVNIPMSVFSNAEMARDMSVNYAYTQNNDNSLSHQATLNGSFLDNQLGYSISQGYANKGQGNSGSIHGNYTGTKGNISTGYNYSKNYQSVNATANGGVLLHSGGVLLGRSMGDSMAIIEADGAEGTKVNNSNATIDSRGYALYPFVSPYNSNTISMDVNTLPNNALLKETTKTVYPTAGSIVKVKFDTKVGYQAIINLQSPSKGVIPFGATATLVGMDKSDENTGIVGDNAQLFMSGLPATGQINIRWGNSASQQCTMSYANLGQIKVSDSQPVRSISAICQ